MSTAHEHYLGLDISKLHVDACLSVKDKHKSKRVKNTVSGLTALLVWVERWSTGSVHACMEATGSYGELFAEGLHDAKLTVSVVNPMQVKGFGKSLMTRTKTDKKDAKLICRFAERMQPERWQPLSAEQRVLRDYVRRLQALTDMRQQEANRLEGARGEVRAHIEAQVVHFNEQIALIEKRINDHIDQNPTLKSQGDLLMSIPGVGPKTMSLFLAEVGDLTRFRNAKALAAYCGVSPMVRESGNWRGRTSMSKMGRNSLRKGLFFPAMSCIRFNPVFQALSKRLLANGKPKMVIIGAAMRKLVHIMYGVLKSGKPFDPALA